MSEQSSYEKLGVTEDASFEEIQAARDRLVGVAGVDEKSRQGVEAAYDAVLMDRLRRRQEGKIKVPDGIRFAEKSTMPPPNLNLPRVNQSPPWLQRLIDTPSTKDVLVPAAFFAALSGVSLYGQDPDTLAFFLAVGVGFTLYFLSRKERKLGRAFLLTLASLAIAGLLATLLQPYFPNAGLTPETFISLVIFLVFWLVSSFLR